MGEFSYKSKFKDCTCIIETDLAIKVEDDSSGETAWVPKSQVDDDSEVYGMGHEGDLIVNSWFAKNKMEWK